jgi:drug/metabolite transporter (DMT)-like permease
VAAVVSTTPEPVERVMAGIAIALTGNLMFSTSDAIVKTLTSRYSVFQIIVFQASFAMFPIAAMLARSGGFTRVRIRHPRLVLLRAFVAGTGTVCGFFSFSQLPLAESYSIAFCAPLLVTILSIPVLGERVGIHRWTAVLIGLAGVLVMVRPGFATLHIGHLGAFVSAVINAGTILLMRRLAREEHHAVLVGAVISGLIVVSLPGMIWTFHMPRLGDLGLFAVTGLLMGSAQFFIVKALSFAPAAVVAPMQYSQMFWAILYGLLLFGTAVDPFVVVGVVIVIGSGVYIMQRERNKAPLTTLETI